MLMDCPLQVTWPCLWQGPGFWDFTHQAYCLQLTTAKHPSLLIGCPLDSRQWIPTCLEKLASVVVLQNPVWSSKTYPCPSPTSYVRTSRGGSQASVFYNTPK